MPTFNHFHHIFRFCLFSMNTPASQAEKLLSTMSLKAEAFNLTAHIDKIQNLTLPETFTREEIRDLFLLPLQEAVGEDRRIAARNEETLEKLTEENAELKKQVAKLQYRINHIFKNNEIKPKPME